MLLPRRRAPLNSLGLPKAPQRDARASWRCRAASTARWWRRCWPRRATTSSGVTLQLYDHGAALARKGACCAGRDIHDARRVAEAMGFPHYVLDYESRFREAVVEEFADAYLAGATPVPCIRCNERVKFRDLLETARTSTPTAWRPGTTSGASTGRRGRSCTAPPTRRRDQSYFLFSTTPRAARLPALPARRARVEGRDAGAGGALRAAGGGQAGQPGHLLRAERLLCRGDREAAARRGRAGRHRAPRRAGARAARGRDPLHRRPAARARASAAASRSSWCGSTPRRGGWSSARARRWRAGPCRWRRSTGSATAAFEAAPAEGWEVAVRVRSTRPPKPARCIRPGRTRARVELLAPEEGVAPGQACVFYAPEGSRVLGGGWIGR